MKLPEIALKKQMIVFALTLLLAGWGGMFFFTAPRRENPEFNIRICTVLTVWPGATAEDVELLVTDTLEKEITEIDEVMEIRSLSMMGQSILWVELEEYVKDADDIWDKVRAAVKVAGTDLPRGCMDPYVNSNFADTSAMVLAVYQTPPPGKEIIQRPYSSRELEQIAEKVRDRIKLLPSVARADLLGQQDEAIYIQTEAGKWGQISLTTEKLRQLIQARNIVAPGGVIDTELLRLGVKPSGDLDAVDQLRRIIAGAASEETFPSPVYLEDLGLNIIRDYEDPPSTIARFGNASMLSSRESVIISFTMKSGENITELGENVKSLLKELDKTLLPPDIEVGVVSDQPEIVSDKIRQFVSNLVQAVLIVLLVAFIVIGLRVALIMAAAIPVVMLISLALSSIFGVQLEQVSIAALIISLGMLVDNAIEVSDNTYRFLENGAPRLVAATKGPSQISIPMLFGTLTTVAAFGPMITISGNVGEYIFSLPVVVSISLLVSWFVAMTLTTVMSYRALKPSVVHKKNLSLISLIAGLFQRKKTETREKKNWKDVYATLCRMSLQNRAVVIVAAFVVFGAAAYLVASGIIGTQFFPPNYRNQFTIDIYTPEGSPIEATDKTAHKVEQLLYNLKEIRTKEGNTTRLKNFMIFVGQGGPRFYLSLEPEPPASNYAQIVVNTTDAAYVADYVKDIKLQASEQIPNARVIPRSLMIGPPVDAPLGIRFFGDDEETLRRIASNVEDVFQKCEFAWDVHHSWGEFIYRLDVEIDEERANLSGVTNASVARSLNAYYSGHYLSSYREGEDRIPIYLRLPPEQRKNLSGLKEVFVEGRYGKVPLTSVAEIAPRFQTAKIRRMHGRRMIEVRARVKQENLPNAVLAGVMPELKEIEKDLPPGYWMEIGGEKEETVQSRRKVVKAFIISILLIVLLMVIKYNGAAKPFLVLLTVPLAAAGGFLGLWITGVPLGFMANLGLLSLAGIIVNAAIVLTEFIEICVKENRESGQGLAEPGEKSVAGLRIESFRESIVQAGRIRIQPLALTTLTTVGGLTPLAFFGGPLWKPLAVVVIFGLIIGTLMTLLVFPALFSVFAEYLGMKVTPDEKREQEAGEIPE